MLPYAAVTTANQHTHQFHFDHPSVVKVCTSKHINMLDVHTWLYSSLVLLRSQTLYRWSRITYKFVDRKLVNEWEVMWLIGRKIYTYSMRWLRAQQLISRKQSSNSFQELLNQYVCMSSDPKLTDAVLPIMMLMIKSEWKPLRFHAQYINDNPNVAWPSTIHRHRHRYRLSNNENGSRALWEWRVQNHYLLLRGCNQENVITIDF